MFHSSNLPADYRRRDFLRVGSLSLLGASLPMLLQSCAQADEGPRRKSCILIWLDGGPTHLETFDVKPDAPVEVRGPFDAISTSVAGIHISELLPQLAKRMKHAAIVRSVTSRLGEHNFGAHYLLTGYKPTPAVEYPAIGSVVSHLRGAAGVLPGHIAVPEFRVGGGRMSGAGFLPASATPFSVGGDPSKPDFAVRNLDFYPGVDEDRAIRRKRFVESLARFADHGQTNVDTPGSNPTADAAFEQAYRLITSAEAKQAFDLSQEPPKLKQRYGSKSIGQCCLLARRLVERGVPFVTVNNRGWDTHENAYTRLKEGYTGAKVPVGLIPSLDLALSALIDDLQDRRLLDDTLIVVMGEFGRTPKLNTAGGRDHWPRVFSVLFAGGGVRGGQVIGASDKTGESPADRPTSPADIAATMYSVLGFDPHMTLHTPDGRPIHLSRDGEVISELVG